MRLLILAALLAAAVPAVAGSKVDVMLGPQPAALERLAAEELKGQLERLYQAEVSIGSKPAGAPHLILVGNPDSNPAIAALREQWPKLTDQGHVLKSVSIEGRSALLVGGGSAVATYWAAAEHGYRLGIRSFTFGDLDPISPPPLRTEGWNIVMEPRLKTRGFVALGSGMTPWGLADQQRLLRQLAKLKFNHVVVRLEPWYPVLESPVPEYPRTKGFLYTDTPLPIDGDSAGRTAFRGLKLFDNADFAGKTEWADRLAAGQSLVKGILATARVLGMTTALSINPVTFPGEVQPSLPGLVMTGIEPTDYAVAFDPLTSDSPQLLKLAQAQLRNALAAYPSDTVELEVEWVAPSWSFGAEQAWKDILARHQRKPPFEYEVVQGGLNERELLRLDVCSRLVASIADWTPAKERPPSVRISMEWDVLGSQVDPFLPAGVGLVTPFTLGEALDFHRPPEKRSGCLAQLYLRRRGGGLPAFCLPELKGQLDVLDHFGWDGFTLVVHGAGEDDPALHLASRAAFDSSVTARSATAELVGPICGEEVVISVQKAFDSAEAATFPHHVIELATFPPLDGQKGEKTRDKVLADLQVANYTAAMEEMYRANTRSREGGRQFTLYFARRFDFAVEHLTAQKATLDIEGLENAQAKIEAWQTIVDGYARAGTAMAAIARSPSDLAIIAELNRDWYRPALEALEALEEGK